MWRRAETGKVVEFGSPWLISGLVSFEVRESSCSETMVDGVSRTWKPCWCELPPMDESTRLLMAFSNVGFGGFWTGMPRTCVYPAANVESGAVLPKCIRAVAPFPFITLHLCFHHQSSRSSSAVGPNFRHAFSVVLEPLRFIQSYIFSGHFDNIFFPFFPGTRATFRLATLRAPQSLIPEEASTPTPSAAKLPCRVRFTTPLLHSKFINTNCASAVTVRKTNQANYSMASTGTKVLRGINILRRANPVAISPRKSASRRSAQAIS